MDIDDIKNSIKKFFGEEKTKEGRELINRWYHYFDDAPAELNDLSDREREKLRKELLAGIRVSANLPKKHKRGISSKQVRNPSALIKMAAGFIIILLALLSILHYQGTLAPEQQHTESIVYRTASNPAGQTSQITLADGSIVWLSAASTLRYPEKFGDGFREVNLIGEAFFEVAENPKKPFTVNSEHIQTRVLGTSFNMRVFEDEEDIQVTVATGKVSVRQKAVVADSLVEPVDPIVVLAPDQQFVFNKKTQTGVTQAVRAALYTSWKDGKSIFENHSFEDIAHRLEQWYGVQIHFSDASLKRIRFKVAFDNNSLQHALRMLQVIEDFEFKMEDHHVWIKSPP